MRATHSSSCLKPLLLTGKPLTMEQLKSEVALLLVAGFETTVGALQSLEPAPQVHTSFIC